MWSPARGCGAAHVEQLRGMSGLGRCRRLRGRLCAVLPAPRAAEAGAQRCRAPGGCSGRFRWCWPHPILNPTACWGRAVTAGSPDGSSAALKRFPWPAGGRSPALSLPRVSHMAGACKATRGAAAARPGPASPGLASPVPLVSGAAVAGVEW